MEERPNPPRAGSALAGALRRTYRPPFSTLLLVTLFVSYVSNSLANSISDFSVVATVVLLIVVNYLNISVILAAGHQIPEGSADHWIRAAFRRRCFWRFFLTELFAVLLVIAGLVAFVIPGLVIGGIVGLGPVIAVLELKQPGDSIRRSKELTLGSRGAVGFVFGGFILLPNVLLQIAYVTDFSNDALLLAGELVAAVLYVIGMLALVHLFLELGGGREPEPSSEKEHERFTP